MEQIAGVRLLAQLGKHNPIDNRRGGRNPENGETISRWLNVIRLQVKLRSRRFRSDLFRKMRNRARLQSIAPFCLRSY